MTLKKAIKIIKHFNIWRRGGIDTIDYSPEQIGIAIDVILQKLESND